MGFRRWGLGGEWGAVWQLANIACDTGDLESSLRLACEARDGLRREGREQPAALILWTALAAAIDSGQVELAKRFLKTIEANPGLKVQTADRARLLWSKGKLAGLEGDPARATDLLEQAMALFESADAVLYAAEVMLDLALLAGENGDAKKQGEWATRAIQLLSRIPGQEAALIAAIASLNEALVRGQFLVEAILALRRRLRCRAT